MYIGKLNTKSSGLPGYYSYRKRGTTHSFIPDKIFHSSGADEGEIAFGSGSLCYGNQIGWNWDSLMDVGIDVRIDLSKECFLGAICIDLAGGSAVQGVEVFSEKEGKLKSIGRFDAQTDGLLEGELTVSIGYYAEVVVIRFKANLRDIVISRLDVIGAIPDSRTVYPSPARATYTEENVPLQSITSIVLNDLSEDTSVAAKHLQQRFLKRFDVHLLIAESGESAITIGLSDDVAEEGYRLTVSKNGVNLIASDRRGLLYAVESLVQLCDIEEIRVCEIEDHPYKSMRGFHLGLPPREEIEFTKRLIRYVLVPMRYNHLIIEFAGGMRFDKHPKISEKWVEGNRAGVEGKQPLFPHGSMVSGGELLEKDEVRDLVEYARSFGFEIIPEVQSWGHVQYITYAYPEIAEVEEGTGKDQVMDTRSADQPPSTFYDHSYCPSNEKSYEIIYDIIDEIVEVTKPERYVHMGHDEIYEIGLCPICKDKDHAKLYAKHVTRMHEYLKNKNLDMMLWSDMLQSTGEYLTHPAITEVPKDIVLLDFTWYFHFDKDLEDNLLPHGFEVVMGNMYSSHYPRFESRMAKKGIIGGQVSTWCRFDEYNLAKKGKIFDLIYSAEMLWSPSYNSEAREVYTNIVQHKIPQMRDELRGIAKPETEAKASAPVQLPKASEPQLPGPLEAEVNSLMNDLNGHVSGYSFDLSSAQRLSDQPIEAKVDRKYEKLIFLHATTDNVQRVAWKPLIKVGEYIVTYSNNEEVVIPVEYAGNICTWTRPYGKPMPQQYYRHQGYIATYWSDPLIQAKTENGTDITALGYEWVNPHPDREIKSIRCRGNDFTGADILLLGISGIQ